MPYVYGVLVHIKLLNLKPDAVPARPQTHPLVVNFRFLKNRTAAVLKPGFSKLVLRCYSRLYVEI